MQSYRTKLYAVRACCTVYNTHAERFCEAMTEWIMFEADLWNGNSLSRANFCGSGTVLLLGLKRLCRLTGYVTDLLSLAVNRLDHGYAVTFQFSASCTLVTRCALFNAHLARAHLFCVPNQLCTAYAVCACCQITETSLQRAKSTTYSVRGLRLLPNH